MPTSSTINIFSSANTLLFSPDENNNMNHRQQEESSSSNGMMNSKSVSFTGAVEDDDTHDININHAVISNVNNETNVIEDDDDELLQLNDIFGGDDEVNTNSNNTSSSSSTSGVSQQQQYLLTLQVFNSQTEATRLSNQLGRARLQISDLNNDIKNLKDEKSKTEAENAKLKDHLNDAAKYVREEYEKKLTDERCKTFAARFNCDELSHQIRLKNEEEHLFDRQFVAKIGKLIEEEVEKQRKELMASILKDSTVVQDIATTSTVQTQTQTSQENDDESPLVHQEKVQASTWCGQTQNQEKDQEQGFLSKIFSRLSKAVGGVSAAASSSNQHSNTSFFASLQQAPHIEEKNNESLTAFDKTLMQQVSSLRILTQQQSRVFSRAQLFEKLFQLASEEIKISIDNLNCASSGYAHNTMYGGYKFENFIRNHCLFSGASPVAESFFKKCPEHHFAQLVDSKTGKLNEEFFTFACHGTRGSSPAAINIQCEGFDPARRACKANGYGDWCAHGDQKLTTALGYGCNAGTILLLLVYRPPACDVDGVRHEDWSKSPYAQNAKNYGPVAMQPGYFVINNPTNRKDGTYMLPLGLLTRPAVIDATEIKNTNLFYNTNGTIKNGVDLDAACDPAGAWKKVLGSRTCGCSKLQIETAFASMKDINKNVQQYDSFSDSAALNKKFFIQQRAFGSSKIALSPQVCDQLNAFYNPLLHNTRTNHAMSMTHLQYIVIDDEPAMVDFHLYQVIKIRTGEMFDLIIE